MSSAYQKTNETEKKQYQFTQKKGEPVALPEHKQQKEGGKNLKNGLCRISENEQKETVGIV